MKRYLVAGGAGFIGSAFVEMLVAHGHDVVVLDALTYAGRRENLKSLDGRYRFVHGDICDRKLLREVFSQARFDRVINFAAESHVDRSIENAAGFIQTNVVGVFALLEETLFAFSRLTSEERAAFRFVHVSTDEVYGSLSETDARFTENTPYAPNSPYSASKASGDHLVRAWHHTYGLPTITTNCSNNYGPRQHPEKLIPHMINCALSDRPLPVYGDGRNIRDWIHVSDHCAGIKLAISKGTAGQSYCFGGRSERRNLDVVRAICDELDRLRPRTGGGSYHQQIKFVEDRKGHDWRYAIDDSRAERELGFVRRYANFESGLKQTVAWYLENREWMNKVLEGQC